MTPAFSAAFARFQAKIRTSYLHPFEGEQKILDIRRSLTSESWAFKATVRAPINNSPKDDARPTAHELPADYNQRVAEFVLPFFRAIDHSIIRLRDMGLSAAEIDALYAEYHAFRVANLPRQNEDDTPPTEPVFADYYTSIEEAANADA